MELRQDILIGNVAKHVNKDIIFQEENAPTHVSKQFMIRFSEKYIPLRDWLTCNSDGNPIENLCGIVDGMVKTNGRF